MSESTGTDLLRVCAAQFRAGAEPAQNLATIADLVHRAALLGAQLVVLPEAAMVGFDHAVARRAEPLDGPFASGLRDLAGAHGVWLVAGMFEPAADGRAHNTVVATDGDQLVGYRKRHLFDAFSGRESDTIAPGLEPAPVFDLSGMAVGLSTCYDVRFADQFTDLGRRGAQLICLPASWASGPAKVEQFRTLVRSRAMDAQAFVLAADQAGDDTTQAGEPLRHPIGVGHSLLAGPLGEVVAELGPTAGLLCIDLPLRRVATVRRQVPLFG